MGLLSTALKKSAPVVAGAAAAAQSDDAEGSFLGVLARNANRKGAEAAKEIFQEQMQRDPGLFTDIDGIMMSGNMQSDAARAAGNKNQGWFVGADGQPRYEVSDQSASINGDFTKGVARAMINNMPEGMHKRVPLSRLLNHDAVFNAYPELAEMPLMLRHPRDIDAVAAYHAPQPGLDSGGISLNLQSIIDNDRTYSVQSLMHEVQHAIQNKEGWARGANFGSAMDDVKNYVEDPRRHGVVLDEGITNQKMEKLDSLLNLSKADNPDAREFADEMAYYMSAGEAEARAVEDRLRMPARIRQGEGGHPYVSLGLPTWMIPEGKRGPTIFQMIEMLTRD